MEPDRGPLLRIDNLHIGFRKGGAINRVVHGADLEVHENETLALVGESGSGKTVTAQAVLRLLPETLIAYPEGEISFQGRAVLRMSAAELQGIRGSEIGMIFQEPMSSLNPLHTVEKQLNETLSLHQGLSGSRASAIALEWLGKVGLRDPEKRLKSYPHQLSGGERQRVMIAMALANSPKLLIADEPTTALDVTIQAQILALIKSLQRELGMAVLFITHDLGIVRRVADRVAVMHEGRIVETGATEEIFRDPRDPYTRLLLDTEPRGEPPESDLNRLPVLGADNLKVWFPIQKGFLRRTTGYVKAVDGVHFKLRQGQRLGEDHAGQGCPAPCAEHGRDRVRGPGHRSAEAARASSLEAATADHFSGSVRKPESAHVRGADCRRRPACSRHWRPC
jgi:microcin C transport system ATP-binding protein